MFGLPLAFATPLVLVGLIGLPLLYYLLRVTPPPPKREPLPTLPIVRDLVTAERQPSRTPWWLLALRLALAACALFALAGPRWNPDAGSAGLGEGPLVVLIDNGWSSAQDWKARRERAIAILESASSRAIVLRATSEDLQEITPSNARAALEKLRGLQPVPHTPDRSKQLAAIRTFIAANANANVVWITDATQIGDKSEAEGSFISDLGRRLTIVTPDKNPVIAIGGVANERDALAVRLLRPAVSGQENLGMVRALDGKGRLVGEAPFNFQASQTAEARISAPLEVRNDIARLEIADNHSAGAVYLLDASAQRRRVALVSGETTDTAQPLVSGAYFVNKALGPYASLQEAPRGGDPIARALEDRPDVMVLVDIGTVAGSNFDRLEKFVQAGGVLIRFAGSGLASANDALLPVRIRRGGRILGGALSWEKPQTLAPFPDASPFAGLKITTEVTVDRQVLAEPDPTLNERTWAALSDGTPLVTAAKRGKGLVVLFHVTADTSWSNLPLSGVFVDMLRRIVATATTTGDHQETTAELANPRRSLDGFGTFVSPPPTARGIPRNRQGGATADHPPGFYGPPEATIAVNTLAPEATLSMIPLSGATVLPLEIKPPLELRQPLLLIVFLLFLLDALAVAWLSGLFRRGRAVAAATVLLAAASLLAGPDPGHAQTPQPGAKAASKASPEDIASSLVTRLAYVITGNRDVDETSRLGLTGLTRALATRTAFEPGPPIGIDPAKDEMVFYSVIYWPMTPEQPAPSEAAMRRIDTFMKNGGTVIFDTRDALSIRPNSSPSAETRRLRQMLANLDIPEIEQVPSDHVLTKTFYLLDKIIGRYSQGETWIEAIPRGAATEKRPARAGDRVSPVVITSNDLAAAWAVDRDGQPRFPMVPGEPRQREMALRSGINLVMYAMTGNYKADQVHVPALLDRLGQ